MKRKINFTLLCMFICFGTAFGQTEKKEKGKEYFQNKLASVQQNPIVRNEKQAINCIKVLNRHKGKFYTNNTEINFQEAKKMINKNYDRLAIEVNWKSERMDINSKD